MLLLAGVASSATRRQAFLTPTALTVHVNEPNGRVDRGLVGFDFHFGHLPASVIGELHPRFVRVDASFEQMSPVRGVLRLGALQARVAQIRAIGADPLVILDYTPAWLGQPLAVLGDRTRTEPTDLNAWRDLVMRAAIALATGPGRVRWFEAWNEPDLPTYWDGTQAAFLDTAAASAEAVHAAALAIRRPLHFGGPASFSPDAAQVSAFVSRLRSDGLPPAFVSWHYYANYPCLGPDGPENPGDPTSVALQRSLGCINPAASPLTYTPGIALVRAAVAAASGRAPAPALILDEWNLSAGGLDRRMNTNVGAAFDAGTLITFQQDKLAAAAFYQGADTDPRPGGWGTVALGGTRRPSWWAFGFWQALAPRSVAIDGSNPSRGLWAFASRNPSGRRVTILTASFSVSRPTSRTISLTVRGRPASSRRWRATLQRIDAQHRGSGRPASLNISRTGRLTFRLPAQAVALLTLTTPAPGAHRWRRRQGRPRPGPEAIMSRWWRPGSP